MGVKGLAGWLLHEGDRDPARIRDRVRTAPGRFEAIVLVCIAVILILASPYPGSGIDWEIFAGAADGDFISDRGLGYYYPYWLLPLFDLYAVPGILVGGLLFSFTNVAGVWFASRVFGARTAVVLAGFGTLSGFYTGTVTGVALAALAGMWWAAHAQRWTVVGALSLIAVAKPQWGVLLAALIVVQARPPPAAWLRMAIVPVPVVLASFAVYGWWPAEILDRASATPPQGNGSLWYFVGPIVVILWLPTVLPMAPQRRMALVAATALMAVPYVQQYDYVVLWVLAGDGLGLVSHVHGLLYSAVGWEAARAFQTVMPMAAYAALVIDPVRGWVARRRTVRPGASPQPA
jgi:hypothetical protein